MRKHKKIEDKKSNRKEKRERQSSKEFERKSKSFKKRSKRDLYYQLFYKRKRRIVKKEKKA